ncbi:orotate phosphoribosyltransferase [candidate division KSB1 bacterium]|nr:orotate phosphoribosyltransferase [candidate division KSB1 bacterium]
MPHDIFTLLLSTQALEIAPLHRPFWYTSGTIGPFYLNGHFLYGNRQKAEELLAFIDQHRSDRRGLLLALQERVERNYAEDAGYRAVIDGAVELAQAQIGSEKIDYVSGGERRDWFFSLMVAHRLQKPALAFFKDQAAFSFSHSDWQEASNLAGAKILHVADLVTEASSYVRAWQPAVQKREGKLCWAINIVDRGQGGSEMLQQHGIAAFHLIQLGPPFFERLKQTGYLDEPTTQMLIAYHREPRESMKRMLEEHPEILREALHSPDAKIRQRAEQLRQMNTYGFNADYWDRLKC